MQQNLRYSMTSSTTPKFTFQKFATASNSTEGAKLFTTRRCKTGIFSCLLHALLKGCWCTNSHLISFKTSRTSYDSHLLSTEFKLFFYGHHKVIRAAGSLQEIALHPTNASDLSQFLTLNYITPCFLLQSPTVRTFVYLPPKSINKMTPTRCIFWNLNSCDRRRVHSLEKEGWQYGKTLDFLWHSSLLTTFHWKKFKFQFGLR